MRTALNKAIEINPGFGESAEMLAFVALVTGEGHDEAVSKLRTALKYQPGNQRYALRIAEIFARQNKLKESEEIAAKIARTTDDDEARVRAEGLLSELNRRRQYDEQIASLHERVGEAGANRQPTGDGSANAVREVNDTVEANNRSLNQILREPSTGEQRTLGKIQKIDCSKSPVTYTVISDGQPFRLTSKDFDEITIRAYDAKLGNITIGCDVDLAAVNAVITWLPSEAPKLGSANTSPVKGSLVSLELVPAGFRIMSEAELTSAPTRIIRNIVADRPENGTEIVSAPVNQEDARRQMMIDHINTAIRTPAAGEKRAFGFLEKIECGSKDRFMHFKTDTGTLKLAANQPPAITMYTPDLSGAQFGCGMRPIEFPVVILYTDKTDKKQKTGAVLALDFVPKSFVLR